MLDMSYEAQHARLEEAAKQLEKFTIHEVMTKAKARKGAALKFCRTLCREIECKKSGSLFIASVFQRKEIP